MKVTMGCIVKKGLIEFYNMPEEAKFPFQSSYTTFIVLMKGVNIEKEMRLFVCGLTRAGASGLGGISPSTITFTLTYCVSIMCNLLS